MAKGRFLELITPPFAKSYGRDLGYKLGSGEASTLNVFNPNSARPLIQGEWLEMDTNQWKRGGDNSVAVAGTPDSEGTVPAFLHYMEKGRTDLQSLKATHCVIGPHPMLIRTKLCNSTGMSVGSKVSVWDIDDDDGIVRRGLALHSAGYVIGYVTRIFDTNDIEVNVIG